MVELVDLGAALTEIFTFLTEPRNVLNTSAACRRWRSLADDEDVWRAKAEEEFGAGSANTAPSCGLAYQRAWIEAAPGGDGASRLYLAARDGRAAPRGLVLCNDSTTGQPSCSTALRMMEACA